MMHLEVLQVGIELTIDSHFPEESGSIKNTAGSNVLGFLGARSWLTTNFNCCLVFISTFYSAFLFL